MKFAPVDEYSGLSMMVQCGSADATRMGLVECVLSAPTHPSLRLLVNPFENPVVIQFILLYTKSEDECFKMYANTSLMVQKILDGFDVDPCRCFGVKWKWPVHEMPCLLQPGNSDDMIYMWTSDKGVWPTEDHVQGFDNMWESGKQHGMELYTHVYNMCLNGELPWATKQAEAYVCAYQLCLNPSQTDMERVHNIAVLSHGIWSLYDRLQKYVCRIEPITMTGLLDKHLNKNTIHEANVLLTKISLTCINMKMQ